MRGAALGRVAAAAVGSAALWSASAAAQPAPAAAGARPHAAVAALAPGEAVRVTAGPLAASGYVAAVAADTLVVRTGYRREVRAAVAGVDALWVSDGRRTARGALVGGITGGVVLGTLGFLAGRGLCEQPGGCGSDAAGLAFAGAGLGGFGGVLVGGLAGTFVHQWRRVYP